VLSADGYRGWDRPSRIDVATPPAPGWCDLVRGRKRWPLEAGTRCQGARSGEHVPGVSGAATQGFLRFHQRGSSDGTAVYRQAWKPDHNTSTLRYLCACYCDIDCYKIGISCEAALQFVGERVKRGDLPAPSTIVRSGQGLWLFWLLHDEADSSRAHLGAYADNSRNHLQLYARINREIGLRLAELGADPVATDAARYVRVPGSFRNDVEEEVLWEWEERSGETVLSYSLLDLGERLGVNKTKARKPAAQPETAGKHPLRRRGFIAANANKLAAFQSLQALRGGFAEGKRSIAAFIFAVSLKWTGRSRMEATGELEEFGRACRPPFPQAECHSAVKSAYKKKGTTMRYCWIADQLDVTPAEASCISETIGKPFPAAARFGGQLAAAAPRTIGVRATACMLRRIEIRKLIEEHGFVPSSRALRDMLLCAGVSVGHVTVMADLRAMGVISALIDDPAARRHSPFDRSALLESLFPSFLEITEGARRGSTSLIATESEQSARSSS
jgi:hypothetical protein